MRREPPPRPTAEPRQYCGGTPPRFAEKDCDDCTWASGVNAAECGVLLLHGFSGSPLETTPLADALSGPGRTVWVARIAWRPPPPVRPARVTWREWRRPVIASHAAPGA